MSEEDDKFCEECWEVYSFKAKYCIEHGDKLKHISQMIKLCKECNQFMLGQECKVHNSILRRVSLQGNYYYCLLYTSPSPRDS